MSKVHELMTKAEALGASFQLLGDGVKVTAPAPLPPELMLELRQHKTDIQQMLRQQLKERHKLTFPGDRAGEEELAELKRRVQEEGYVLCYSQSLDDFIAFCQDDIDLQTLPPGFVAYTDTELELLFGDSRPDWSLKALKLIHQAKRVGAKVMDVHDDAAP